jgi:hypothetical protein
VIFLLLCLTVESVQGFSFRGLSTWRAVVSLLSFSVLDHTPSSILICCVIYDLEGSNDTYPQDANLTLAGEIYSP